MTTDDAKAIAERALPLVDLTDLSETCDAAAIDRLCAAAETPHGPVAAVCVWPAFVARSRRRLGGRGVRVATVVNFPSGAEARNAVIDRTRRALDEGAEEIDLVMPYRAFAEGDRATAASLIGAVKAVLSSHAPLKVILETGELRRPDLIRAAAETALAGGADFLKTSTGKVPVNATPEAAEILLRTIRDSGGGAGFKAAGGLRTVEDAGRYLAIADEIMGPAWATPQTFRFGASSLLGALLGELA